MATREYKGRLSMTREQLYNAARAQYEIYQNGIIVGNTDRLIEGLGAFTTILGLVFIKSTPVGVAVGVTALLLGMSVNAKEVLKSQVRNGYEELMNIVYFFDRNPRYDIIEFEAVFFEHRTPEGEVTRLVTTTPGTSRIIRVHVKNQGWIPME